jgi:hypothetical protein
LIGSTIIEWKIGEVAGVADEIVPEPA